VATKTLFSIVFIVSALICYSIGVWSEKLAGRLKEWHLVFFWVGLATDTAGTTLMFIAAGGLVFDVHSLTGMVAILLMGIHAIWATMVITRRDENAALSFHRFSVLVWAIWLIPFLTGFFLNRQM
jgi:uncharacterized repeat protein (TIGR03987 family)